jgi:GPI ethanolamine phosphate transferase 3 subunit O
MVWKVFTPRYMLGVVELICVDVAVLLGLWPGFGRIVSRITRVFASPAAPRASSSSRSSVRQQSEKVPS